jgi:hypothetical protein
MANGRWQMAGGRWLFVGGFAVKDQVEDEWDWIAAVGGFAI